MQVSPQNVIYELQFECSIGDALRATPDPRNEAHDPRNYGGGAKFSSPAEAQK
jgi:hypothetical protein